MTQYDLCVLFAGSQTETEVDELAKKVDALLAEAKAEVKHYYGLGRRKLSYTIKGQTHGDYRCWLFEAEPASMIKLEEKLRLSTFVVRHLLLKMEDVSIEERIKNLTTERPKEEEPIIEEEKPVILEDIIEEPKEEETEKKDTKEAKKAGIEHLDEKLDELLESDAV